MPRFIAHFLMLAFCFLVWMPPVAEAALARVLGLNENSGEVSAAVFIDYVSQHSQTYTIEDIIEDQTSSQIGWIANQSDAPGFGFDANTFWFRLVLRNDSAETIDRLFEIKNPVLDEVLFYQVNGEGELVNQVQTGDQNPTSIRPFFHHNLVIPFSLPANAQHRIYFRVTTAGSMEFPITLWSPESFQKRDQINLLLFGGLFGIMLVMALYNFFIFTLFHDNSMAYYGGYSFFLMLFLASIHGFSAQYLWPEQQWLRENSLLLVIPLTAYFAVMFSASFLQMDRSYPQLNRLTLMAGYFSLGLVILIPFFSYSTLIRVSAAMVVPVSIAGIGVGLLRWWQGYKPARYFVLAWSAFLVALSYYALTKFGLLQRTMFSEFAVQLGAVSEAVLFAFALADRMNTQRKSYQAGQKKALFAQKDANEKLEISVAERTSELRSAMAELESANSRLQTLSMQDGLTGIRNRRYFDEKLEKEWHRCLRNSEPLGLLLIDIDFFKAFNDKYGHLAGDECLKSTAKLIEQTLTRPSDTVARYGGEEFVVILSETGLDGVIHVANGILTAISDRGIEVEGETVFVTVSIGAASALPTMDKGAQSVIAITDQALYKAKSAGRNCIKHADDQL